MQNNQLLTKSRVALEENSLDKRKIYSLVSSMMFEVLDVLSSVYCKLELGEFMKVTSCTY